MSKIIIAVTFSNVFTVTDDKINGWIDKLWEATGFANQGINRPYGRIIRHGKDSNHEEILDKVLTLLPA